MFPLAIDIALAFAPAVVEFTSGILNYRNERLRDNSFQASLPGLSSRTFYFVGVVRSAAGHEAYCGQSGPTPQWQSEPD